MPNLVNESITAEYGELVSEQLDALFVQPVGLTVEDVNAFRGKLAESSLRMQLVKGSLAKRVLVDRGFSDFDPLFEGPAALILAENGDGDVDSAAIAGSRVLEAWRKETGNPLPEIKGGIMDGDVLDQSQAKALAKLPTKADMQSILVGQILGPGRSLSGQMIAGGSRIAGAIASHVEKLEQDG